MTFILKLDLNMVKMCLYSKSEVSMLMGSKVIAWTDIHTDGQTHRHTDKHTDRRTDTTENITYPHTRVVMNASLWYPNMKLLKWIDIISIFSVMIAVSAWAAGWCTKQSWILHLFQIDSRLCANIYFLSEENCAFLDEKLRALVTFNMLHVGPREVRISI